MTRHGRYPLDQYVVDLRSELDALHLLASHYRSQMWLAETHYPVGDAFPAVIVPEAVLLLAVHPRDDFQITFLSDSQQVFCVLMAPLNLMFLLQYLAEQVKQPVCDLPLESVKLCVEFVYRPLLPVDYVILLGEPVGKGLAFAILGEFVLKTAGTLALRVQLLHQSGHKVLVFLEFLVHYIY